MEFLGDAILQAVISDALYTLHPDRDEGTLTKAGAWSAASLPPWPHRLGGTPCHGQGQRADFEQGKVSALEDALEALVLRCFLMAGWTRQAICSADICRELANPDKIEAIKNPKGELQELLQAESEEAPTYELLSSTGPDHDREFEVVVKHLGQALGQGRAAAKKRPRRRLRWRLWPRFRTVDRSRARCPLMVRNASAHRLRYPTGLGDFTNGLQSHSAAGLCLCPALNQPDSLPQFIARHVIQRDDIRTGLGGSLACSMVSASASIFRSG